MDKKNRFGVSAEAEHTLVCLSASPSNEKIVNTAAKMAKAFGGGFTALYVQTPDSDKMEEADKKRLQYHIRLAESLGATVTMVYGDDVSLQIAEFARISGVTKIVIGRSGTTRRHFWSKPTLTEQLTEIAPNVDIHIIPDSLADTKYKITENTAKRILPSIKELFITLLMIAIFTAIGSLLYAIESTVVTFAIMLIVSVVTATLAGKLKDHAKQSSRAAFRTKTLFDTNQLLQKAKDDNEIMDITAKQLVKLLGRDIVVYPEAEGKLSEGYVLPVIPESDTASFFTDKEKEAVCWAYQNKHRAGATTDMMEYAKCLYLAIRINEKVYGVIGVHIKDKPLDAFENSFLLSILGECALAIQNSRNAKEKEQAAVLAKNEQLRANLLRAISHDLRTPLTSISGNASNLLSNWEKMDDETRMQVFTDISDDSQWLISLVENLLSVTRIEEGRMNFNMSMQLMDEVIDEALKHINRKSMEHNLSVEYKDDLLLARMDARLIMQVIINIVDNAIKYTPAGSDICITAQNRDGAVAVSIADNGMGICDKVKPHVFEMFYTGDNKVADSRRSLGLGLSLCRSIVSAHGGELKLEDNTPHGCVFTFTLPTGEVNFNE